MKKFPAFLLIVLSCISLKAQTMANFLVFKNVTVIDMTGAPPKPNMTIVISGKRIAQIGKTNVVRVAKAAKIIDGTGKFIIPGLWDMHWHSFSEEQTREIFFPMAIANGVTGVRDLFGDCIKNCQEFTGINVEVVKKWRKEAEAGKLLAPRFVESSQTVDGAKPVWDFFNTAGNAEEARQAVKTNKQRGVDFIKVYSLLSRDAYFALADEAKKQNIAFAGHVPIYVTPLEASDAGQKSIEHLDFIPALSSREEEIMRATAEEVEKNKNHQFFSLMVYHIMDGALVKFADSYDSRKVAPVAQRFIKNGTWLCPTLVLHRADAFMGDSEYEKDTRLKYMPKDMKDDWAELRYARMTAPEMQNDLKRVFPKYLEITGAMRRGGVNFLAGTDSTMGYVFPGFSLHDELALFVQSGFTPMEALQTATINPAVYLGLSDSLGTIEKGKIADLVLLEANPLEEIRNTSRISAVVLNGRLLRKATLDKMLADIEANANKK